MGILVKHNARFDISELLGQFVKVYELDELEKENKVLINLAIVYKDSNGKHRGTIPLLERIVNPDYEINKVSGETLQEMVGYVGDKMSSVALLDIDKSEELLIRLSIRYAWVAGDVYCFDVEYIYDNYDKFVELNL